MKHIYNVIFDFASLFQSLALVLIRFVLAYGFYDTAIMKWKNIDSTAEWFMEMNFILPKVSVYMVATFEMLAVPLFVFGLLSRAVSIPLIIIIIVAIFSVHFANGFSAGNNGYEIPLYYGLLLFVLFSFGSGKLSLDYLIFKK